MAQLLEQNRLAVTAGERNRRRLIWLVFGAVIATACVTLVAGLAVAVARHGLAMLMSHYALAPLMAVVYALVGALVAGKQPRNAIGWIFLAVGLLGALQGATGLVELLAADNGQTGTLVRLAEWLNIWLWLPVAFMPTMFIFLIFPDGRLPSPRWRVALWAAILGIVLGGVAMAFHPGPLESWGIGPGNPYGVAALVGTLELLAIVAQFLVAVGVGGAIGAFVIRFRRSAGVERAQMKWLLYALALVVVGLAASTAAWYFRPAGVVAARLGYAIFNLAVLGVAVAASMAILRHQMYGLDVVISRTLVYGALTVCIVILYALLVGGLSALFQAQGNIAIGLLATGAIAVLFQPMRERLQEGVNRLYYGERDDPLEALSWLGRRLETALDPDVVLPTLAETIAQTLRLPYVAIEVQTGDGSDLVAQEGMPVPGVMSLPLKYQGATLGLLNVGPRGAGESFGPEEKRLLETIAHQAGPAVHAVQLTTALRQSRLQIVSAREEERRRLRRDLHDGLGATLAALHLEAGVLRRAIRANPSEAETMVDELRANIRGTIDDIRRLVYALRPPTLDQLGLVAAVRALAAQCSQPSLDGADGHGEPVLRVRVESPEEFPPLPAAVEVAAYRIVQEALTNVVRHARAGNCVVRLELTDALGVEVVDNGAGLGKGRFENGGLGLLSMRERANELGGTCLIEAAPGGGTRVLARLPVPEA